MTKLSTREVDCLALLFDLDGVLVDSTPSIERVWTKWARDRGLDAKAVIRAAHGRPTSETIALVGPDLDAQTEIDILAAAELDELDGTAAVQGAAELVGCLPIDRWAIVTSGANSIAEARLRWVGLPIPRVLITADIVRRGKPHPDGYLMAASRLGVRPDDCIVLEDSPPGVQAAQAARIRSIAVLTTHTRDELSCADNIVQDLSDIRVRTVPSGRICMTFTSH